MEATACDKFGFSKFGLSEFLIEGYSFMSDTVVVPFHHKGNRLRASVRSASTDMALRGIDQQMGDSSKAVKVSVLVIVDSSTGDDYNPTEKVAEGAQVIILNADRDGVEQITEALQTHAGVACMHVICDGGEGSLQLGSTRLHSDNLDVYGWQLQHWAELLTPNAEILLYNSHIATGDRGRALIQQIGLLTGATIKVL